MADISHLTPKKLLLQQGGTVFQPVLAEAMMERIVNEFMRGRTFEGPREMDDASIELSQLVKAGALKLELQRYKFLVQVTISTNNEQGLCVASTGFWDPETDNWAAYTHTDENYICTTLCFAIYQE